MADYVESALASVLCAVWHEHKERTGHIPEKRELQSPLCMTCLHLAAADRDIKKTQYDEQVEEARRGE